MYVCVWHMPVIWSRGWSDATIQLRVYYVIIIHYTISLHGVSVCVFTLSNQSISKLQLLHVLLKATVAVH